MNASPSDQEQRRKSFHYALVATVSLFLMALVWALGAAFIYIFLGVAVFFFFLAAYNYPWKTTGFRSANKNDVRRPGSASRTEPGRPPLFNKASLGMIRSLAIVGGSMFLLMFILIAIFSGDDDATAQDYYARAEDFRERNEMDSARIFYRKALQLDEDYVDAWNNYGITWLNQERYDSALFLFDKVLALDEDYEHARYNKALTFFYQKDYRRSLSEDWKLIEQNPEYNDALQLAGDNYYEQKNYDSALFWYQQGYDKGSRNAWICHVMGYLYDVKGDAAKAIPLYKEAVDFDPYKKDVFVRLGELVPGADGDEYREKAAQLEKDGY